MPSAKNLITKHNAESYSNTSIHIMSAHTNVVNYIFHACLPTKSGTNSTKNTHKEKISVLFVH